MIEVTLLGTGSPLPDANRAGPATLVAMGEHRFLVDCGRGVLMRLAAAGVWPLQLTAVLLTHHHSDHVTDLNDIITTRWAMSPVPSPLHVIGPPGTRRLVERTLVMLEDDIGWRIGHHADLTDPPQVTVEEITSGVAWNAQGDAEDTTVIQARPTDHRPVTPTVGYRFEYGGAVVAIAGDTVPCDGLDELCAAADLYVQTTVRRAGIEQIPSPRLQDVLDYHSTTEQAGETANRCAVGTLVMTHMVPPVAPGGEQVWIDEAAANFGGAIVVGSDLQVFTVHPR